MPPLLTPPLLTIVIPWDPNITHIGGFLLTWHGFFTAVGILVGVQLALRMGSVVDYDPDEAYTLALVGVPCGIIGARALFVFQHWGFYRASPGQVIALTEGGISIWGAIFGGLAGALLFAWWRGYPLLRGLDIAAFGLILGQAVGRIGGLINGAHLGRAANLPWAVVYTNPLSPAFAHSLTVGPQHPATTYEMIGDVVLLGLMFWAFFHVFRRRPGLTFFLYFIGYAALRFWTTFYRVDSTTVGGTALRVPQVVAIVAVVIAIPALWLALRQPAEPGEADRLPLGRVQVRAR